MDCTRSREGQAFNDYRTDDAIVQQFKQFGHVGLEFFRVRQSAGGDGVEHRATAAEQAAQRAPQLDPGQAERRGSQAFAPDRHGLRPVADEQPAETSG